MTMQTESEERRLDELHEHLKRTTEPITKQRMSESVGGTRCPKA